MSDYDVIYSVVASANLRELTTYVAQVSGIDAADRFAAQITQYLGSFSMFPERGTRLPGGRRRIGFRRRVTIIFRVRRADVLILRIAYRGRDISKDFS